MFQFSKKYAIAVCLRASYHQRLEMNAENPMKGQCKQSFENRYDRVIVSSHSLAHVHITLVFCAKEIPSKQHLTGILFLKNHGQFLDYLLIFAQWLTK